MSCTLWAISPGAAPAASHRPEPSIKFQLSVSHSSLEQLPSLSKVVCLSIVLDGGTHKQSLNTLCFGMLGRGGTAYTAQKEGPH